METIFFEETINRETLCFFNKTSKNVFIEFLSFYRLNSSLKLYHFLHILIFKVGLYRTYLFKLEFEQKPRVSSLKTAYYPSYRTGCRCSCRTYYCSCRTSIEKGWLKTIEDDGFEVMEVI